MHPPHRIRVCCVDDHLDIVEMYAAIMNGVPDLDCCGRLTSTRDLPDHLARIPADVLLLDLTIPGEAPLQMLPTLLAEFPRLRVLAVSGYDDQDTVADVIDAGGWGLLSKHADPFGIIDAVRRVHAGEVLIPGRRPSA